MCTVPCRSCFVSSEIKQISMTQFLWCGAAPTCGFVRTNIQGISTSLSKNMLALVKIVIAVFFNIQIKLFDFFSCILFGFVSAQILNLSTNKIFLKIFLLSQNLWLHPIFQDILNIFEKLIFALQCNKNIFEYSIIQILGTEYWIFKYEYSIFWL